MWLYGEQLTVALAHYQVSCQPNALNLASATAAELLETPNRYTQLPLWSWSDGEWLAVVRGAPDAPQQSRRPAAGGQLRLFPETDVVTAADALDLVYHAGTRILVLVHRPAPVSLRHDSFTIWRGSMRGGATIPTQRRPSEHVETVIVGAGQAGLVMSALLVQHGREHVVLEQTAPAHAWHSRWDSFALNSPSGRSLNLPGLPYAGADPNGFALRDEVIAYFDAYCAMVNPPLRLGARATAVTATDDGRFIVDTDAGPLLANNVVLATGRHQTPLRPALAAHLPSNILQLHTHDYRNPAQLPPGNVLVVGSGQSSCQIVEELHAAGHRVYLSVGRNGRSPIRYRGRHMSAWVAEIGDDAAQLFFSSQITGRDGGRSLNLHAFARDGMVLLGRLAGTDGHQLNVVPNLYERLAAADEHDAHVRRTVDAYIAANHLDCPPEPSPPALRHGFDEPLRTTLDLNREGITSIIWGTGYGFDLSWVNAPIVDAAGEPLQVQGVTEVPGLYVLGFTIHRRPRSSLLAFVGAEATTIVEDLIGRA